MFSWISWLLSPVGRFLAGIGAILLAIFAIYQKGRKDSSSDIKLREAENARKKLQRATNAADATRANNARGGLLNNDGYRRD